MEPSFDWKDIANRAIWTFVQAAIGVLVAAQAAGSEFNKDLLYKAGAAGIAALVSVGKNMYVQKRGK
jgi:hypothetical protein